MPTCACAQILARESTGKAAVRDGHGPWTGQTDSSGPDSACAMGEAVAAKNSDAQAEAAKAVQEQRKAADEDGFIGTLCCWTLLNLSQLEPAKVQLPAVLQSLLLHEHTKTE